MKNKTIFIIYNIVFAVLFVSVAYILAREYLVMYNQYNNQYLIQGDDVLLLRANYYLIRALLLVGIFVSLYIFVSTICGSLMQFYGKRILVLFACLSLLNIIAIMSLDLIYGWTANMQTFLIILTSASSLALAITFNVYVAIRLRR